MIIIYLFETFHTPIERKIINTELTSFQKTGHLTKEIKSKISSFKKEYIEYDLQIIEMSKHSDKEIENNLEHSFKMKRKYFKEFSKEDEELKKYLIKYLKKPYSINELYLELRNKTYIIPLAIYFFNHNGEIRKIRELICAIVIASQEIKFKKYSNIFDNHSITLKNDTIKDKKTIKKITLK